MCTVITRSVSRATGGASNKQLRCVGHDMTGNFIPELVPSIPRPVDFVVGMTIRSPSRNRFSTPDGGLVNRLNFYFPLLLSSGNLVVQSQESHASSAAAVTALGLHQRLCRRLPMPGGPKLSIGVRRGRDLGRENACSGAGAGQVDRIGPR